MDGSSDRAQLLYKLIKPSLHPAWLAKGQSHSWNDSRIQSTVTHTHTHIDPTCSLAATTVDVQILTGTSDADGLRKARRTSVKWDRTTQPWSLLRFVGNNFSHSDWLFVSRESDALHCFCLFFFKLIETFVYGYRATHWKNIYYHCGWSGVQLTQWFSKCGAGPSGGA